jgi:hypothetical protein
MTTHTDWSGRLIVIITAIVGAISLAEWLRLV